MFGITAGPNFCAGHLRWVENDFDHICLDVDTNIYTQANNTTQRAETIHKDMCEDITTSSLEAVKNLDLC